MVEVPVQDVTVRGHHARRKDLMKKVELWDHQSKAIEKLSNGKILYGGVGSGKSITALAYFVVKECGATLDEPQLMTTPKDLYVITTAKKRDSSDWTDEAGLFGISTNQEDHPGGVSIQVDSWNNIGKYVGIHNAFFIFDEQKLVGTGAWVKSFLKIAKTNHWILLSGTPGDTWMDYVPVFLANGFYRNRTQFKETHVVYKPYSRYPQIQKYVLISTLVRHRDEILVEMPVERHTVRHLHDVVCDYSDSDYSRVWNDRWDVFQDLPIETVTGMFYLARRVVNSAPSRLDRLLEVLEARHRAIVFYNFDYELEALRARLDDRGIPYAEHNGHKHEPVPTGNRWAYLVQYQSGAEAWNCTVTDTMVFYSLTYSYRQFEQAQGRIDRMNTPYTDLHYYLLWSRSPIDRMIRKALRNKQDFNERSSKLSQQKYYERNSDEREHVLAA